MGKIRLELIKIWTVVLGLLLVLLVITNIMFENAGIQIIFSFDILVFWFYTFTLILNWLDQFKNPV